MNDFDYDVLQKKRIASGAKHIKHGSKSKKCTLPSDYLTAKQRKELNGTMDTYKLDVPMEWKSFKKMPLDIQQEYISRLQERFEPRQDAVASMFGVRATSMNHYFHQNGLKWVNTGRKLQNLELVQEWQKFLGKEANPVAFLSDAPDEQSEDAAPVSLTTMGKNVPVEAKAEIRKGSLTLTGNMADIASKLVSWMGVNKAYNVTIDFEVV